jgi:hypothetical protein
MTFSTEDFTYDSRQTPVGADAGPVLDESHWGYAIRDRNAANGLRCAATAGSRFAGIILLMAALGLWVLPDTAHSSELLTMKLAAMVMFTVVGGALFWAGRAPRHLEFHVDRLRGELRIGRRDLRGGFRLASLLRFEDVASVYLLRSKDRSQPTRLFLRLAAGDGAIEVASGAEEGLELLRLRLTRDLARIPRQPVDVQLARHGMVTA